MSDRELRDLERDLRETGSPRARVQLARALARSGRADEAIDLLLADATAREELEHYPFWASVDGEGCRTWHVDVLPVQGTPRLLWHRRSGEMHLLGGRHALYTTGARSAARLDPDTGAVLERLRAPFELAGWPRLERAEVLIPGRGVAALVERRRLVRTGPRQWVLVPGRAICVTPDGARLESHPLDGGASWEVEASERWLNLMALPGRVFANDGEALVGLDAAGRELFRRPGTAGVAADAHGLIVRQGDRHFACSLDGDLGAPLAPDRRLLVRALAPSFVFAEDRSRAIRAPMDVHFVVIDRATGGVRAALRTLTPLLGRPIALARDVIHLTQGPLGGDHEELIALSPDGERLWSVRLPGNTARLLAAHRRVYGITDSGDVFAVG